MKTNKKKVALFSSALIGAKEIFASLKAVSEWAMSHKFLAGVAVVCLLLLSVSQANRRGEYYFRTAAESRYLQELRKKYAGEKLTLSRQEVESAIAKACSFLAECGGGNPAYDSPSARDILFGTALVESGLTPRFQDSGGDAIGLFQVEYGTYRDILNRVLKKNNPLLFESILKYFGRDGKLSFGDLQTNSCLSAVFARLKYAQSGVPLPPAGDYEAQGAYYKKYYNTHFGRGSAATFARRRLEYEKLSAGRCNPGAPGSAKASNP